MPTWLFGTQQARIELIISLQEVSSLCVLFLFLFFFRKGGGGYIGFDCGVVTVHCFRTVTTVERGVRRQGDIEYDTFSTL